jgi:hypothetical protein
MKSDCKQADSVRKIRATCLTGMSQSMTLAEKLVREDELTGIVLHSDGYANDPSPSMEYKTMDAACARLSKKNVFVNTVAYSDYSDFSFLSHIAASVSGTCVKAVNSKEVYDAIESACNTLVSGVGTPIEIPANGADYVLYLNKQQKKLVGANGDLTVKGAGDGDAMVIRITDGKTGDAGTPDQAAFVASAYSRYCIGAGRLNEAKYAMLSSNLPGIYKKHFKALSSNQIADMCADIENFLFGDASHTLSETIDLPSGTSILDLMRIIEEHKDHVYLNLPETLKHYKKRSVKRLAGTRDDSGVLVEPDVDTEYVSDTDHVKIGSFDYNRANATVNMKIPQKIKLVDRKTRKGITSVAGIQLDLTDFKQYTVVGDGEVNLKKMVVRIASQQAFKDLQAAGLLSGCKFSPTEEYVIDLESMPVCGFGESIGELPPFEDVAELSILSKFLNYVAEGKSSIYTESQVEELKKFSITAALNLSMPTTNPYTDLNQAISDGEIDTRTVCKVDVGNALALNYGKFESTKKFMEKFYTPAPEDVPKEWFGNTQYARKALSSRTKTKKTDEFQLAIYDELLGLSKPSILAVVEKKYGISGLCDAIVARDPAAVAKAKADVSATENKVWRDKISPFVFFVSSTGLMPDGMNVEMVASADDLSTMFPDISLAKGDKEKATFFVIDGKHVVSLTRESAYFSTEKGVEKAKSLVKTASSVEVD